MKIGRFDDRLYDRWLFRHISLPRTGARLRRRWQASDRIQCRHKYRTLAHHRPADRFVAVDWWFSIEWNPLYHFADIDQQFSSPASCRSIQFKQTLIYSIEVSVFALIHRNCVMIANKNKLKFSTAQNYREQYIQTTNCSWCNWNTLNYEWFCLTEWTILVAALSIRTPFPLSLSLSLHHTYYNSSFLWLSQYVGC